MTQPSSSSVPSWEKIGFAAAVLVTAVALPLASRAEPGWLEPEMTSAEFPVPTMDLRPIERPPVAAAPLSRWAASFPTEVRGIAVPPPPEPRTAQLPTARVTAVVGFEGIDVTWQPGSEGVRASAWFLERRGPEGVWVRLASGAGEGTFHDGRVDPRSRYEYRVRAEADPSDLKWRTATRRIEPEPPVTSVVSASEWRITFQNPQAAKEDRRGEAQIRIEKYDPDAGVLSPDPMRVLEGDRIGRAKSRAYSVKLGRTVEVDFNTGMTLVRVSPDVKVGYVRRFCEPTAEVKCPGPKNETLKASVARIEIRLADGGTIFVQRGEPSRKPDSCCSEHR